MVLSSVDILSVILRFNFVLLLYLRVEFEIPNTVTYFINTFCNMATSVK
jgi:hypothetical protein